METGIIQNILECGVVEGKKDSILIRDDICLGFLKGCSVEFHLLTVFSVSEKSNPE